jgi:hypothetical protein
MFGYRKSKIFRKSNQNDFWLRHITAFVVALRFASIDHVANWLFPATIWLSFVHTFHVMKHISFLDTHVINSHVYYRCDVIRAQKKRALIMLPLHWMLNS